MEALVFYEGIPNDMGSHPNMKRSEQKYGSSHSRRADSLIRIYLIWDLAVRNATLLTRSCPSRQLSRHWPRALHLAGRHPLTSDWQCKYRQTICSRCTTLNTRMVLYGYKDISMACVHHQTMPLFKMIVCCFDSEITSSLLCHKPVHTEVPASMMFVCFFSSSFFKTKPVAVRILCVALTVTNALGNGKRPDIVFYGLTFETLLFFWWITVYSECIHEASFFKVCSHCPWHKWQNKNISSCSSAKCSVLSAEMESLF